MNEMPCIIRETAAGYVRVSLKDEQFARREVELEGAIDRVSAMETIRALRQLSEMDSRAPIRLLINSNGGSVIDGLAIYDTMKALPCPVWTICVGEASSMATIVLAGGEQSHRYILPNAQVMIHDPLITGDCGGPALSVDAMAKRLMKTRRQVAGILADCTGKKVEEVLRNTARDTFFTAQQAKDFGIVDEIIMDWGEARVG